MDLPIVSRRFWLSRIAAAFSRRSLVWLPGVRRAGKTLLARAIPGAVYFDCELPSVRRALADPEAFLDGHQGLTLILDEVHRLPDPSEILKIAADHYPGIRVLATGSSSITASTKFRDTLTGRKTDVWLTPLNSLDMADFSMPQLERRLLNGGLPPYFLAGQPEESDFHDWMEAYWAKDIQELFRLQQFSSFRRFVEILFAQSGGIFEATRFAPPCEVSRPTIANYLSVVESTFVAHVIRPFSTRIATEIVSAPKVYAFDTGFACCYRGWIRLRPDDFGLLWEHFVLNEIHSRLPGQQVLYWRDKQHHEIDFVLPVRGEKPAPIAIECKWSAADFEPRNLMVFRGHYPQGRNFVVSQNVRVPFTRNYDKLRVEFVRPDGLIAALRPPERKPRARKKR